MNRRAVAILIFSCLHAIAGCGNDDTESSLPEADHSPADTGASERASLAGLGEYIERSMAEWRTPGLAIVVVHDDEVVYSEGFGVREVGKSAPVDTSTVFALSSNGKAFTAAAVGMLVDDGVLEWDDPVIEHLPEFKLPDPWVTEQVTLRDLLSHRLSGDLGIGHLELWAFTGLTRGEVIHGLRYLKPGTARFRSRFQYSNPNISAAGLAAAAEAGTTWEQFVQARILEPLEMESATTSAFDLWDAEHVAACYMCALDHTPGYEDARIDDIAMPHVVTDDTLRPIPWRNVGNIAPAGAINANASDVANWVRMHLGEGMFEGGRILSEAVVSEMHAPQMVVTDSPFAGMPGFGHVLAYGLGWYVTDYRGRKIVMHTGAITGWRSGIAMLPEENLGVAVLTNQQSLELPNSLPLALAFTVFDRVLDLPRQDWSADWRSMIEQSIQAAAAAEERLASNRILDTHASVKEDLLAGTYRHPAFGELILDPANEAAQLAGVMRGRLVHWENDVYRVTWLGPTPIPYFLTFSTGEAGRVTSIELQGFGTFLRQ